MPTLSVRLTTDQFLAMRFAASRYGTTASKFVRHILSRAALEGTAPGPLRAKVADAAVALGLPKNADPSEVLRTLELVVADLEAAEGPPPPGDDATPPNTGLSALEQAAMAKLTPDAQERFRQLRAWRKNPNRPAAPARLSAADFSYELTPAEQDAAAKMTPDQAETFTRLRTARAKALAEEKRLRAKSREKNIL